jgi:hypothetical protein
MSQGAAHESAAGLDLGFICGQDSRPNYADAGQSVPFASFHTHLKNLWRIYEGSCCR